MAATYSKILPIPFDELPGDAWIDEPVLDVITPFKKSRRNDLKRKGRFPMGVLFSPRCRRYRVSEIREYLRDPLNWPSDRNGEGEE
jgi:hypothetical protein